MLLHVSTVLQYQGWHLALPETCEPSAVSKEAVVSEVSTKSTKTSKIGSGAEKCAVLQPCLEKSQGHRNKSLNSSKPGKFSQQWNTHAKEECNIAFTL